jgi:hypothetical protein
VIGQINVTTNPGQLVLTRMANWPETGGGIRDDVLYIDAALAQIHREDARWDPSAQRFTYWWAYDEPIPAGLPPTARG